MPEEIREYNPPNPGSKVSKALYEYDDALYKKGLNRIAGIDEAGRGPLAGPVVAAAVVLQQGSYYEGLNDSKRVPKGKREKLFWEILCNARDIGVGITEVEDIDKYNILNATKLAMTKAVNDLSQAPDLLLIDAISLPSIEMEQHPIIKGDSKSASIAAASIIAKVVRDRLMLHYHNLYPRYGLKSHKGYPTKTHIENLNLYGPSPIHRKSFSPVRNLLLPFS